MKRILICIDDSPYSLKAVNKGVLLAKSLNAEISLIHVIEEKFAIPQGDFSAKDIMDEIKAAANDYMFKMMDMFTCTAFSFVDQGNPAEKIIKTANMLEIDLIVMGTHGRTGLTGGLMGSVAEEVVRLSQISVLVVPFKAIDKTIV